MFNTNNKSMQTFPFPSHNCFDGVPFSQHYQLAIHVVCCNSFARWQEIPRYWIKNMFFQNPWREFFINLQMEIQKGGLIKENYPSACSSLSDSRDCSEWSYFLLSVFHVRAEATIMVWCGQTCRHPGCASQGPMTAKASWSSTSPLRERFGISWSLRWLHSLFGSVWY